VRHVKKKTVAGKGHDAREAPARAIAAARAADDQGDTSHEAVEARLVTLGRELAHLTEALAQGAAALPTVIAGIQQRETEKADLEAERARRAALRQVPALDDAAIRSAMASVLIDWQTALHAHVAQSQQALRKLLVGRVVFTPDPDGGYHFTAEGRLDAVVAGRLPGLPTSVVSPRGTPRVRT
jgi:hypothetical protein